MLFITLTYGSVQPNGHIPLKLHSAETLHNHHLETTQYKVGTIVQGDCYRLRASFSFCLHTEVEP